MRDCLGHNYALKDAYIQYFSVNWANDNGQLDEVNEIQENNARVPYFLQRKGSRMFFY